MSDSQKEIFTKIWHEYRSEMCRFCYANLKGHNGEVEEIVEKAFYLLWKKMSEDETPPVPQAWLYKTIDNLIKMEYRRQKKDNKYLDFGFDLCANLQYVVDLDEEMAQQELNRELIKAVNEELTDDDRELIKYLFLENKPHREIAAILGISENAVKQRRFRMIRKNQLIAAREKKKLGFIEK